MQNVNEGHSAGKRRRRGRPTSKPQNGEVTTVKVDPLLWRLGIPADLLLVVDAGTVVRCNSRKHRDYMRKVMTRG